MMTIENPTDSDVSIVIAGHEYVVPASGKLEGMSVEYAMHWKQIHGFLIIKEDKKEDMVVEVAEVAEVVAPEPEVMKLELPVKKTIFKKLKK